jgi:hypothetical protein
MLEENGSSEGLLVALQDRAQVRAQGVKRESPRNNMSRVV